MKLFKSQKGSILVEFVVCGIMFIGFVMGMIVIGIWIYNDTRVNQAARIAANNMAVTNNRVESENMAVAYLKKTLIACPTRGAAAYNDGEYGYGVAEAYMDPLFPGFEILIKPGGTSTIKETIHIRKEATKISEFRFR